MHDEILHYVSYNILLLSTGITHVYSTVNGRCTLMKG
jgi:hypothetical protein